MMRMKNIKTLVLIQLLIFASWLYSFEIFINLQTAWISSFLIMLGSMYSYNRLVNKRIEDYEANLDVDVIEKIEDPYDLYSEQETEEAELDIKDVIKQERAKLKGNNIKGIKEAAPATVSVFRLVPYLFLIVGFMALKNSNILHLTPYLSGVTLGILSAFFAKGIIIR